MKSLVSRNKNSGFTLIELMVVLSIISLISSIVLSSFSAAKTKARDTKTIMEMKELQSALNLYFSNNGDYPLPGNTGDDDIFYSNCDETKGDNFTLALQELLNEKLISSIPKITNRVIIKDTDGVEFPVCFGYNHGKNLQIEISGKTEPVFSCGGKSIKDTDYAIFFRTEKNVNFPKLMLFTGDDNNESLTPYNNVSYCITP
jgi:prepilin-type N-terminal cleavage/methylation domain-containing protein